MITYFLYLSHFLHYNQCKAQLHTCVDKLFPNLRKYKIQLEIAQLMQIG